MFPCLAGASLNHLHFGLRVSDLRFRVAVQGFASRAEACVENSERSRSPLGPSEAQYTFLLKHLGSRSCGTEKIP